MLSTGPGCAEDHISRFQRLQIDRVALDAYLGMTLSFPKTLSEAKLVRKKMDSFQGRQILANTYDYCAALQPG